MAKKIGNLWFGAIIGSFMLLFMGMILNGADNVTVSNSDKIGDDILSSGASATNNYRDTEIALQDNTFDTGVFALPDEKLVETRGISQGNIISKDTPSGVKQTISDVATKANVPGIVQALLITLVASLGIIVLIRVIRGDGAT